MTSTTISTTPSSLGGNSLPEAATTVAASSLILKATAGNLFGVDICTAGTAGYLMLFNSATAPADGTVTPAKVFPVAANAGLRLDFITPIRFTIGITAVFSSTGPFTKTASATAFISGEVL
jgi:hypothetical protein